MLQLWWSDFGEWNGDWRQRSTQWLGAAERERLTRLHSPARRDQFLAGRLLLRSAIAQQYQLAPAQIRLAASAPVHAQDAASRPICHTSISHSGRYLVVALAERAVGVDCEQPLPRRNWRAIAAEYFSPLEGAYLRRLSPTQAEREFLRIWTCKEAWAKCTGTDLGKLLATPMPLSELDEPGQIPHGLRGWWGALADQLLISLVSAAESAPAPIGHYHNPSGAGGAVPPVTMQSLW